MNKKGIFIAVLAIFTLVIFTFAYYKIAFGAKTNYREIIGKNQAELYESYFDGEKAALYIDESAKQAAYSAILDLAGNGGYGKDVLSDCGNVVGYNLWYINGKECYPKNIKDSFSKNFIGEFDKYLANYGVILFNDEDIKGLRNFFNIHVDDGNNLEIYGKSREKYLLVLFKINTKNKIFNDDVVVKFAVRTNP